MKFFWWNFNRPRWNWIIVWILPLKNGAIKKKKNISHAKKKKKTNRNGPTLTRRVKKIKSPASCINSRRKLFRSKIHARANFVLVTKNRWRGRTNDLTKLLESLLPDFRRVVEHFPGNLVSERPEDTRTAASKNFADPYPGSLVLPGKRANLHGCRGTCV